MNFKTVKLKGFEGLWMVFAGEPGSLLEFADAEAPTSAPARSNLTRAVQTNSNLQQDDGQVKALQKCPHCGHPATAEARLVGTLPHMRLRVVIGCMETDCPVGLRVAAGTVAMAEAAWNSERSNQ